MSRSDQIRALLLLAVVAFCSTGALCNLNLPQSPAYPHGPATVRVTVRDASNERAPGVQVRIKRFEQCENLFGCGIVSFVETRTGVSDAAGEVLFTKASPGAWKLEVIGSGDWIVLRGTGDFGVSFGKTVELTVWVQRQPAILSLEARPRKQYPPQSQSPMAQARL